MVVPSTTTSSISNEPPLIKPDAVTVVNPLAAPLVMVAVPSVNDPPVTAPEAVTVAPDTLPVTLPVKAPVNAVELIDVAPVTTPASTLMVLSSTIADPLAGVIFTAPEVVLIVTAASPALTSSALMPLACIPVNDETSTHAPSSFPSDVHTCPDVPAEEIKYSPCCTLLADKVPSARSVRSASSACLASNCVCTADVTPSTKLISAAVAVTPSIMFSSAAVAETAVPFKFSASTLAVPST